MRSSAGGIARAARFEGATGASVAWSNIVFIDALGLEHEGAREQPVGDAPERVDVGPAVDRAVAQHHLRGHERGRAGDRVVRRSAWRGPRPSLRWATSPKSSTFKKSRSAP